MNYPSPYTIEKRPIVFQERKEPFVCKVCGRRGKGPPNAVVHPGRCRAEWTRRNSLKATERERQRREAARAQQTNAAEV